MWRAIPRSSASIRARLGVAGDSAGGTLAAVLCRMARDAARTARRHRLPAADLPHPGCAWRIAGRLELAQGYFLDGETLQRDLELYVPPGAELSDVRLSPLLAEEFADLPPAFIHTAEFDPFSDEGEAYAQRLGGFGVPVHGRAHTGHDPLLLLHAAHDPLRPGSRRASSAPKSAMRWIYRSRSGGFTGGSGRN